MRLRQLFQVAVCVFFAMGCEDPTATSEGGTLIGTWARAPENLAPKGWYQIGFTFTALGAFTGDVRSYGVYPGQPQDELSSYSRTEGSYRTEDDRLIVTPRRLVVWDRFYGRSSPENVYEPYPYTGYLENMRYEVSRNRLTLRYTSYPADAPVPTTMELSRER